RRRQLSGDPPRGGRVTTPGAATAAGAARDLDPESLGRPDFTGYARPRGEGEQSLDLIVEGVHCGGCVQRIERALARRDEVTHARLNLTTRRLALAWRGPPESAEHLARTVEDLGYPVAPYEPARLSAAEGRAETQLLRALAVAGFAAGNVMLLSVAVWAGHFQDMGPATRGLLHWFSALIALPAIAYAGRPFFRSALQALKSGHTNMDVPISLAVLLAAGMSLFETMAGGRHVYFDSAVTLLFFLLIGRYLDRRARGKARAAAERLLALDTRPVTVLSEDGARVLLPAEQVGPGMTVLAAAGERIAVDGRVRAGRSELDTSLITGETLPAPTQPDDPVFAGTLNLTAPLTLEVTAVGEDTLLAEIVRLMELAEQRRARYVELADRVARLYAPLVHGLALATFLGWTFLLGAPWQTALLTAVAVLIITCPCALGLAVPAVQVIASGRLLGRGTLLKSATALERLAVVDTVVFDKTGTLTEGRPELSREGLDREALGLAASLAGASRHPLARALARAAPEVPVADGVREHPGLGLSLTTPEGELRLGSRVWSGLPEDEAAEGPELWLTGPGRAPQRFTFADPPRADAAAVIAALQARGFAIELLSGDRRRAVARLAEALGVAKWRAACSPADKVARLEALAGQGRRVLMVGDGLNDAPALAAASVSLSPSSAVDISQTAADAVFQGRRLGPVLELVTLARRAQRLVKQNLWLAFGYNAVTIPLAVAGLVTPLVAAIAMSSSSLVVIGNALRLARSGRPGDLR
ncbi:MAG: heavy metal translocating P-type ATPase, partial [Rhodospirillales bacterium]|nr:heavy metal translocating P-type ATPase [Rhodospirillales bacterium]